MDLSQIQPALDWLTLHQHWVAAALVMVAFFESVAVVGVVIPGVVFLFGISAVAGSGALGIWPTLACAFIGAVSGDCISFFLGKALKQRVRTLWPFARYPHWIDNAEDFIGRHGGKSVVIGRFVGPVRPVIPLVAGMLDMPASRFVGINLLSAMGWAPVYILPGFIFGASLRWGTRFPAEFSTLLLILLTIVSVGLVTAKLSHWHLSPDSRLYGLLHRWVQRQHNVRLVWYWLAERRAERIAFPLPFLVVFLGSLVAAAVLTYLATNGAAALAPLDDLTAAFYQALQHPFLSIFFAAADSLIKPLSSYALVFVLIAWLAVKRHFSAALHCALAVIALEALLALWLPGFAPDLAAPDTANTTNGINPSASVMRISLICLLAASIVAREIGAHQRWLIYGFSILPVLVIASAQLYEGNCQLSGVLISVAGGFALGSALILSFGRHQTRQIAADWSFWLALALGVGLACLISSAI